MTTRENATVHVVAYALWPTAAVDDSLHSANPWKQALLALPPHPAWQALAQTHVSEHEALPADSPCCAHEWAMARSLGWDVSPAHLPTAAWQAAKQGLNCPADHGWAFIDLVTCEFHQGQVRTRLPDGLSAADSLAFKQAMAPYFLEDGMALYDCAPGRYLAHAKAFVSLPCVSVERAVLQDRHALHDIPPLNAQTPAQRLLQRLQNEMQMLLYTHPLNAPRTPAINSFWVSGCGSLPPHTRKAVQIHTPLRDAYAQHHHAAWAQSWLSLAESVWLPALQRGEQVVLCGVDRSLRLGAAKHAGWRQIWQRLRPLSWIDRLS